MGVNKEVYKTLHVVICVFIQLLTGICGEK